MHSARGQELGVQNLLILPTHKQWLWWPLRLNLIWPCKSPSCLSRHGCDINFILGKIERLDLVKTNPKIGCSICAFYALDLGNFLLLGLCLFNISRGQVFKLQRQLSSSWLQSASVSFMPDLNLDQLLNVLFLSALLGTAFKDKEEKCGSRGMIHRLKSPPTTRPQVYPVFVHYVNSGPSFTSQGH